MPSDRSERVAPTGPNDPTWRGQYPSWGRIVRGGRPSLSRDVDAERVGRGRRGSARNLTGVLSLDRTIAAAIAAHARRDHPDEACGVVAGPAGSDRALRHVPMLNAAMSPTFYEFDSTELLALYKEMEARDEEPVVIYHSHTATEAYPSRTDIDLAQEPNAHYLLVSTAGGAEEGDGPLPMRSYRIVDGEVSEEEVRLVDGATGAAADTRVTGDTE